MVAVEYKYKNKRTDAYMDKYNHPGIYAIYIDGVLVYIGKSHNMANRISQHLTCIKNPKSASKHSLHRYLILNQAHNEGYTITFDVVYYANEVEPMELDKKLAGLEVSCLTKYKPALNYYINPKTKNNSAYTIKNFPTLMAGSTVASDLDLRIL